MKPHFWASLEFLNPAVKSYLEGIHDLSGAPWRPGFFYPDIVRQGYDIFPIAREGEEYGMYAISAEFWENFHKDRIQPGMPFSLGVGIGTPVANGVVTRLGNHSD